MTPAQRTGHPAGRSHQERNQEKLASHYGDGRLMQGQRADLLWPWEAGGTIGSGVEFLLMHGEEWRSCQLGG